MFAIAFDLVVKDTAEHNPRGVSAAYVEIGATLANFGFRRVQGGLYTCENEDMANLMDALDALADLPWFAGSVREIRAFRVDQWSDFAKRIKLRR